MKQNEDKKEIENRNWKMEERGGIGIGGGGQNGIKEGAEAEGMMENPIRISNMSNISTVFQMGLFILFCFVYFIHYSILVGAEIPFVLAHAIIIPIAKYSTAGINTPFLLHIIVERK